MIAAPAPGKAGVDRRGHHQDKRRQNKFVGNGAFGQIAEKEGATDQLAGDDYSAHRCQRIDQHDAYAHALARLDAEDGAQDLAAEAFKHPLYAAH